VTTVIADPGHTPMPDDEPDRPVRTPERPRPAPTGERPSLRGGRLWLLIGSWLAVVLVSLLLTVYLLEPLFQARDQSRLLDSYRADISRAAAEASSLPGVSVPTKAPEVGSPVAILEIGDLKVQQVVVEGATSSQTQAGPGHVAGTAAPGQPGNAVVVGRRLGFGGPFSELERLEPGALILVTTTQGQIVYEVDTAERTTLSTGEPEAARQSAATGGGSGVGEQDEAGVTYVDELYGPTEDDRLTLVTSASAVPWNASEATVVVAKLKGTAFEPTPQGGRTDSGTGLVGEPAAWAPLLLALLGFAAAAVAAIYLYRRWSFRSAYLLTTPPLIVFTILMAEQIARLMPSWL
jgi:sortase A